MPDLLAARPGLPDDGLECRATAQLLLPAPDTLLLLLERGGRPGEYFGRTQQSWIVNFRVRSLSAMVAQLQAASIAVSVDPEQYHNGRFARVHDPEGNPVEVGEPQAR